jgi:hydrogenase nickel incorporation protein HypA/HybF
LYIFAPAFKKIMHELSIAMNIIEIAEEQCRQHRGIAVKAVTLEIGCLCGVVPEALEFALQSAKEGTLAESAEFTIEMVEGMARCTECGTGFSTEEYINACPDCASFKTEVEQGREMRVKSLQII